MAPNPDLDNTGALALKPPRVNIFARPAPAERTSDSRARGIFDATAACQPGAIVRDTVRPPRPTLPAGRPRLGSAGRLIALAALCVVVGILALRPHTTGKAEDPHPAHRHATPRAIERAAPSAPPAQPNRGRPHRRHRGRQRMGTRQRRRLVRPQLPAPPPAPAVPKNAPARPAPRPAAPVDPLPAPVPRTAPPEFM
jgi:hypothetical protein